MMTNEVELKPALRGFIAQRPCGLPGWVSRGAESQRRSIFPEGTRRLGDDGSVQALAHYKASNHQPVTLDLRCLQYGD